MIRHFTAVSTRAARRAGMTLIELMVVIVVLGIVASMVVPHMGGLLAAMELRRAGHDLGDLMDYCYRAAVTSGRVHALVLAGDGRRFDVVAEQRPAEQTPGAPIAPGTSAAAEPPIDPQAPPELTPISIPGYVERVLPAGVRLAEVWTFDNQLSQTGEGDRRLLFFPDGTAEFATVTLTNRQGDQCVVSLDGLSGMIEVGDVKPAGMEEDAR
jgi:type II secretion system protein H